MGHGRWICGDFAIDLREPTVMGVLNVTPDSFSDGGRYADPDAACSRAQAMIADGAAVIDVGGESTRPGATPVGPAEETARVTPVIACLAKAGRTAVSVDTRHAEVAHAAVLAGASIINDISGFRDQAMVAVAARHNVGVVVVHMRGDPATMQDDPRYDDVVADVTAFLAERGAALEDAGVARDRIVIDPGIGFGKTHEHNLELLRRLPEVVRVGYPVLVGVSRKRFIGNILGEDDPARRVSGSLGAAVYAVMRGASIVRAHDVAETAQALAVVSALRR